LAAFDRNLQELYQKRAEWTVQSADDSDPRDPEMPQRFSADGSDRLTVIGKIKTPMEDYNSMPSSVDAHLPVGYGESGEEKSMRTAAFQTRQVDPLHSCIEAKCSGYHVSNYIDCVYQHCIISLQLGEMVYERKRLSTALSTSRGTEPRRVNDFTYTLKLPRIEDSRSGTAEGRQEGWNVNKQGKSGRAEGRESIFSVSGSRFRTPENENRAGGDERVGVAVRGNGSGLQTQWPGGDFLNKVAKRGGITDNTGVCESRHCSHLPVGEYAYNNCAMQNCADRTGDTQST